MLHLTLSTPLIVFSKSAIRAVISIYVFNILGIIKLANHPVVLSYDSWITGNSFHRTGNISVADQCRVSPEPQQSKFTVFFLWRCDPTQAMASSFLRILVHTPRRITFGRNSLDEWSARRRDLYLTTHNTHNRQTSMPPVGFEPTISAGERPQTYVLDRAATETDQNLLYPT